MHLKVCGMRDFKNITEVAALNPKYMGFIFYEKSMRFAGHDFVMPELPPEIFRVGVFVNNSTEYILEKVKKYNLDFVQLHGDETIRQCEILSESVKIIKAFGVDENFDFSRIRNFISHCSYFLFDTKSLSFGGTGKSFPWSILKKFNNELPFFLSGGISPENINDALLIKNMNIHAIDINSRFETEPGIKNIEMIKQIKNVIRN